MRNDKYSDKHGSPSNIRQKHHLQKNFVRHIHRCRMTMKNNRAHFIEVTDIKVILKYQDIGILSTRGYVCR